MAEQACGDRLRSLGKMTRGCEEDLKGKVWSTGTHEIVMNVRGCMDVRSGRGRELLAPAWQW